MPVLVFNNFGTTLADAISETDTEIPLAGGACDIIREKLGIAYGTDIPEGSYFYLTIFDAYGSVEVVRVNSIGVSGDTITVTRGVDNTSRATWLGGDKIHARPNAAVFNDFRDLLIVNFLDFGGVGDGVTDNLTAFEELVYTYSTGGLVYVPPGRYMMSGPCTIQGAHGLHIFGAGMGATVFTRNTNFNGASFRFFMGENNSISDLTLDCDGYSGRGIYVQDIGTDVMRVEVLNCPDRPFGMNGGGNASYGLDSAGRNSDEAGFTSAVFFPMRCKFIDCRAIKSGRTAFSQKRMRYSEIRGNFVDTAYSEGITVDKCDYSIVKDNVLINVSRTDSSTAFPDKVAGVGYLTVGDGGVGGIGIDGSSQSTIESNKIIDVQKNLGVVNNRSKPAINFVNNIEAAFGCAVIGNTIDGAKLGVYLKAGAGGNNFKHTIIGNVFKDTGTAAGTGSAEFGDVWIDAGCSGNNAHPNRHINASLLMTDNGVNNTVANEDGLIGLRLANVGSTNARLLDWYEEGFDFAVTLRGGATAGTGTYNTNGQRLWWTRVGRVVHFNYYFSWSAHTGTGQLRIYGLPFTSNGNAQNTPAFACEVNGLSITGQVFARVAVNAIYMNLFVVNDGAETSLDVPPSGELRVSGSYLAA